MTAIVEVREATPEKVGCISARAEQYGPEICWAVGKDGKFATWYVTIRERVFAAAGITASKSASYEVYGPAEAEQLVRLIGALYTAAVDQDAAAEPVIA